MFNLGEIFQTNRNILDVEAKLSSSQDHNIHGGLEVSVYHTNDYTFEFELEHRNRRLSNILSIRVDGQTIGEIEPQHNQTRFYRFGADGPLGFIPAVGQKVEVFHANNLLCAGTFEPED